MKEQETTNQVIKEIEIVIQAVKSMQSHYSYCQEPRFLRYMHNINHQIDILSNLKDSVEQLDYSQVLPIQKEILYWCKYVREYVRENTISLLDKESKESKEVTALKSRDDYDGWCPECYWAGKCASCRGVIKTGDY